MPGLIDSDEGLAFGSGLQFQNTIGDAGLGVTTALVASDDFNRADGALTTPWVQTMISFTRNVVIATNAVTGDTASDSAARYAADFANNQYSQAVVQASAAGANGWGVAVRMSAVRDGYVLRRASGVVILSRWDGASGLTQLAAAADPGFVTSDVIRLEAEGTTLRGLRNGTQFVTATDATYASGDPGVYFASTTAKLDDWQGGDL